VPRSGDEEDPVGHPVAVAYPDKLLADDEQVVRHLHPHWLTVFWPIVAFLVLVGLGSFGAAFIPEGSNQGVYRLGSSSSPSCWPWRSWSCPCSSGGRRTT
jgi:hypothetical protein